MLRLLARAGILELRRACSQLTGEPACPGVAREWCAPEGRHESQGLWAHGSWQHVAFLGDLQQGCGEACNRSRGLGCNTGFHTSSGACTPALLLPGSRHWGTSRLQDPLPAGAAGGGLSKVKCKGSEHQAAWIATPRGAHGCAGPGRKMLRQQLAKAQTQPAPLLAVQAS